MPNAERNMNKQDQQNNQDHQDHRDQRERDPDQDEHGIDQLSAAETARLVRSGELSPTQSLEAAIRRIERRNPSLNAFVHLGFEQARASARLLEQRLYAGEDVGVLAGVPTAVKDLFGHYPGWPATIGGIPSFRRRVAGSMSVYPRRMEGAGAIVVGMTNSPVLGYRGTCDNLLFGPTSNPFDVSRNSGGSSGGSAAAVADGMLAVAGANDGGGSIRIPAAWCGVVGFQPSQGVVPQTARPDAFDHVSPYIYDGPVARTVEDTALALSALAGYDSADPLAIAGGVDWMAQLQRAVAGMHIGLSLTLGGFPVETRIQLAIERAARVFESLGAHVTLVDFALPLPHGQLSALWCKLVGTRMLAGVEGLKAEGIDLLASEDDLPEAVRASIEAARGMPLAEIQAAQRIRTAVYDAFEATFSRVDLLLAPTVGCLAVENMARGQTVGPSAIGGEAVDPLIGWALTYLTNFSGHPSASVPAGLVDGLPVGLQIIGRRRGDADVLAACAEFERAQPWAGSYALTRQRSL